MIRCLILIFASMAAVSRCIALDLQQQLMMQSAISYLETQFEDLMNSTKPECRTALRETFQSVKAQKYWALKIVDSIPKIPSGILEGNVRDYGNYDECLSAHDENSTIKGKYCLVNMVFTNALTNEAVQNTSMKFNADVVDLSRFNVNTFNNTPLNFFSISNLLSWGFCVPHACDGQDVTAIFDYIIYRNFKEPFVRLESKDNYCQIGDSEPMPLRTLVAMIGFGIVFIIVGASTIYDVLVYQKRMDGKADFLISFSLLTNGRKLFLEKRPCDDESMSCLYGIRTIGCILIIVLHVTQYNALLPSINGVAGINFDKTFSLRSLVITGGPLTFDTFFIISGMLLSYNFFKEAKLHQEMKLSGIPAFYLHRIIRFVPSMIAVTIYHWCIFKWSVDGPAVIPFKATSEDRCQWWAPMLFVSNYMAECISHTWYPSIEMQLFLISPIFLFTLLRKPTLGYAIIATAFCISTGYSIHLFYMHRLSITVADFYSTSYIMYLKSYLATHIRMTPWLLGLCYGHFLHTNFSRSLLNSVTNIIGWLSAISTFLYFMITHHSYSVSKQGMFFLSMHYAFNRPLWALSAAFIIYSCKMGFGGLVNYTLSLNIFRPLSNLCYSMYLTHIYAVMVVLASRWTSGYISDTRNFVDLCSSYTLTAFSATLLALCFEYPFVAMEYYFIPRGKQLELKKTLSISSTTIETLHIDK